MNSKLILNTTEDLFTICLQTYGRVDYLFKLMNDNNVNDINSSINNNSVVFFDKNYIISNPILITKNVTNPTTDYLVKSNQTIFDLALQLYGNINQIFEIINDNNSNGALLDSLNGNVINFTGPDNSTTNNFIKNNIVITTG